MQRSLPFAIVIGLFVAFPAQGQKSDSEKPQTTPALPVPDWVKMIDQGKNDPRLKGYSTPEGIKVEIVAEAPVVANPIGMAFNDDRSLYVAEWRTHEGRLTTVEHKYRDGASRKFMIWKKQAKDVIKVLRLNKEKAIYDQSEVVLEEELPSRSTFLFHDGWLYSATRGPVCRYRQSKDGGPFDVKQVIASGISGTSDGAGLTVGNDGLLYVSVGGSDDSVVEGSDGSRATVVRTGAIFRCRPNGAQMQVHSTGFLQTGQAVAFDAGFHVFQSDHDLHGPKVEGSRLIHATEGSDFGSLRLAKPALLQNAREARSGETPPLLKTDRGFPGLTLIYNDTYFPTHFRGLLLHPDAEYQVIRAFKIEPRGSTFKAVERFDLLKSVDPRFYPEQVISGPDGAIYVLDLQYPQGKGPKEDKSGRILRLTWSGTKDDPAIPPRPLDSWAKIRKQSDEDLLKTLESDNFSDRLKAQQEFVHRGEKHRPILLKVLQEVERPVPARIAALGALNSLWNDDVAKAFVGLMPDIEPDIRRLAVEALGRNGGAKGDAVVALLDDGDAAVQRAAAMALGRTNAPGVAEILVNAMAGYEGKDAVLLDGFVRAIELTGKDGMDRLIALTESGDMKKFNRAVETFPMFRTRAGADSIPHLLKNPHLTIPQRVSLIRSYNHYLLDPPVSVEPVLEYLVKTPDEAVPVKMAGLNVLALNDGLKSVAAKKWLLSLLDDKDTTLHKAAIPLIAADAEGAKSVSRLLLAGKLDKELRPVVIEALKRHAEKDAEAAKLLKMIME